MVASVLLHLSLSSPTAGVSPQALRSEQLLARVQAHYDRTTRLHARFRQETRLQGFAQVQSGEGEVWILKPGQMRWHYTWGVWAVKSYRIGRSAHSANSLPLEWCSVI